MMLAALFLEITTRSLLKEMADLDRLTRPAAYVTRQFSSFDPSSKEGGDWFANDDRGHYLGRKDGEFVLARAKGPGAIVRIWSANPGGILKIRLDGRVVLEEDFKALLSGKVAAFPPPFGAMRSRGGNLYYPFPFARDMEVTCTEGGQYYHVNVRTWPQGTAVATWSPQQDLPTLRATPTGVSTTDRELSGPGVVRRLEVDLPRDADRLRALTLRIFADDELCVWSPLGDFFGTAPGRNRFTTLPAGITPDGVGYMNFPMPFARSLRLEVDAPARMLVSREERPLRFHAFWRGSNSLKTRPRSDWAVLHCEGQGRLVGCALTVRNPVRAWWGEGDEKIRVDGEVFPSTFGTGSEDYFGYAWSDTHLFQAPYHAQTRCDGPANRGFTSLVRYHILDDIPFSTSLRFDLEVWHWVDTTMGFSTVAYWYAAPGATDDFEPGRDADRKILPLPEIPAVPGAIEGERFKLLSSSAGQVQPQDLSFAEGFSREEHLWWRDAGPGDTLKLRFLSEVEGRRRFIIALTRAVDYGIVRIEVNGKPLGDPIDLFAPRVMPDGERVFENVPVHRGDNEMVVTIVGSNPRAHPKNHMFGIDYIRIPK